MNVYIYCYAIVVFMLVENYLTQFTSLLTYYTYICWTDFKYFLSIH